MTALLIVLCCLLAIALGIVARYAWKLSRIVMDVEDALQEALDVCDQSYNRMSRILEIPLAVITPEVKQILLEMGRTRDSVLYVSNVLAEPFGGIEEEIDDA